MSASVLTTQRDSLGHLKNDPPSDDHLVPIRLVAANSKPIWLTACGKFSAPWQLYGSAVEFDVSEHLKFGDIQAFSVPSMKKRVSFISGKRY